METFTQPKITGYRQLSEAEVALMNEGKALAERCGEYIAKLRSHADVARKTDVQQLTPPLDQRWISIGATDLQTGLMALTRGVARRDHVMPTGLTPTVFMTSNPLKPPSAEQRHHGVACVTARDFRWERGDIKEVRLFVNGTLVAHGEVVVVNEKFGIRLTDVISPSERIRKLK